MPKLTNEEVSALEKFRKRVEDVLPKDEYSQLDDNLIRWLRARDMNLDKAEQMLRNSLEWRKENQIDQLLVNGVDSELMEKFPFFVDGYDKSGRPVVSLPFGTWDVKSFITSEPEAAARFVRHFNVMLELLLVEIKRLTLERKRDQNADDDRPIIQFVFLNDLTGYSFGQLTNLKAVQAVLKLVGVLEGHYPETMAAAFALNAPSIFTMLFGLMKPIFNGHTVEKVQIYSSKEEWLPVVLDMIEPSQLRESFGGTKM